MFLLSCYSFICQLLLSCLSWAKDAYVHMLPVSRQCYCAFHYNQSDQTWFSSSARLLQVLTHPSSRCTIFSLLCLFPVIGGCFPAQLARATDPATPRSQQPRWTAAWAAAPTASWTKRERWTKWTVPSSRCPDCELESVLHSAWESSQTRENK